ncbi:NAD(P)/FAD-dependent oxidoreductase [Actinocorallia longicatena]|uniref:NAD(P)/FAD-dependent oxidoreductase n=1 Tax=Actinocorallia longicatena TaxID=111803 RepID=A0ABP6QBP6_9ACTN
MTVEHFTTVVIGAGHAGLAASHFLTERSIDHVVLERGEIANSWRHERWDSLRLLTPNRLSGLPGLPYDGPDPDGYMTAGEVAGLVERFAKTCGAPVRTGVEVTSVRTAAGGGYEITTSAGTVRARTAVIASGACNVPVVPPQARDLPSGIAQLTPFSYRGPADLPEGGVLVVGASATGVQLAAEIRRTGRPVTLAVGEHVRLPRLYRGRDVLWWMDASGVWDQGHDEVDDLARARSLPSPQLAGTPERATLDLNELTAAGVETVGRLAGVRDGHALFSGGLRNVFALADLKLARLLDSFDAWALATGIDPDLPPPERPAPTRAPASPRLRVDLAEFRSVLWATGFRPDYSWLDVPVLDGRGRLRHEGGVVTASPGLYALGLPVLLRRRSTFLCGIEHDARTVVTRLAEGLSAQGPV